MDGIKARIEGDGVDTSVEFSMEEMMARHQGKPWAEMSEAEQEAALKDYALLLFSRQEGTPGDVRVSLESGTFAKVQNGQV